MYTKIACILTIAAIFIFLAMLTFFDKGFENIPGALVCMGAIALIVVFGIVISIIAVIKERSILSWICASVFILPSLAFAINMAKELRPHNHKSQKKYIKNIRNEHWSSIIYEYRDNQWLPEYFKDKNMVFIYYSTQCFVFM